MKFEKEMIQNLPLGTIVSLKNSFGAIQAMVVVQYNWFTHDWEKFDTEELSYKNTMRKRLLSLTKSKAPCEVLWDSTIENYQEIEIIGKFVGIQEENNG